MNGELLAQKRKWFRLFPEGTLEFTIITRVLALMLLMALAVAGGAQRPFVLAALVGVLWIDYALLIWWALQLAGDLNDLTGVSVPTRSAQRRDLSRAVVLLPSVGIAVALIPWSTLLSFFDLSSGLAKVLTGVGAVGFLATLVPAYRALKSSQVGSPLWSALLLFPVLHWFALHRVAAGLDRRVRQGLIERGIPAEKHRNPSVVLLLSDFSGVLGLAPWVAVVVVSVYRGWPSGGMFKVAPVCGTILAALFAIANLAALEGIQRQFVTLLRKS